VTADRQCGDARWGRRLGHEWSVASEGWATDEDETHEDAAVNAEAAPPSAANSADSPTSASDANETPDGVSDDNADGGDEAGSP
jgi:hypothetical protein